MSSIISLQTLIADYGYPRSLFIDGEKVYTKRYDIPAGVVIDTHYYVIKNNDEKYCAVKAKSGKIDKTLGDVSHSYLYNAIVKYIILEDIDLDLKINMVLYILYYNATVNGSDNISDNDITEGVILHVSNIIKLMIEKEHTLYRDSPHISDAIDELRQTLIFERAHTNWRQKINLRR